MTVKAPDRFKAANAFWIGISKIGLTPAAVLRQARVPVTVYDGKKNLVTDSAVLRGFGVPSKNFSPVKTIAQSERPIIYDAAPRGRVGGYSANALR